MVRKLLVLLLVLTTPLAAEAQPPGKVYRIGFILTTAPNELGHFFKALAEGLRELGYVEGRNVVFERRFAEGRQERLPALAAELVQLKVDVLVTGSNPVIAAVKQVTATIPVVMAVSRDPVGAGFITSLARPGGNITGLANEATPEIIGKNLDLLKEAAPRLSRVAFLWNPVPPGAGTTKNAVESAARRLGLTFQSVEVRGPTEFESAFAAMIRERVNAGLARAKAEGKTLGRPRNDDAKQRAAVMRPRKQGIGILKIARTVGAGTSYVQRIVAEIEAAAS